MPVNESEPLVRIVDDDAAIRDGLEFMLAGEGWQTASYGTACEFLTGDAASIPGCIILDVRMPGLSGVQLQAELAARGYDLPIIFLTGHGDIDMAVHTLKAGAFDFLQKPVDGPRLLKAVADAVARNAARRGCGSLSAEDARARWESLTGRESQILELVAQGFLNKVIGERLGLSTRTVEVHRANGLRKLQVKTAAELNALLALIGPR